MTNVTFFLRLFSERMFSHAASILLSILLFTAQSLLAQTQVSVFISDTTVERGTLVRMPVRVIMRNPPAMLSEMSFTLRFAPSLLAFRRAEGGGANIMQCASPRVDSQFVNLSQGSVRISCTMLRNLPANASDTLTVGVVEFLTLAGSESNAVVTADAFTINGQNFTTILTRPAIVRITGAPLVAGNFRDAIGQNYPNPAQIFASEFPYTVAERGFVDFDLVSSAGIVVEEFPRLLRQQGRFVFNLQPKANLPGGLYVLRMTTPRGVQHRVFLLGR